MELFLLWAAALALYFFWPDLKDLWRGMKK